MTDDPYEALATLLERELHLARERRLDELQQLQDAREELQSALPAAPPPAAAAALRRCQVLHEQLEAELASIRETLLGELRQVRRAQRAAAGYAPVRRSGRRIVASA